MIVPVCPHPRMTRLRGVIPFPLPEFSSLSEAFDALMVVIVPQVIEITNTYKVQVSLKPWPNLFKQLHLLGVRQCLLCLHDLCAQRRGRCCAQWWEALRSQMAATLELVC